MILCNERLPYLFPNSHPLHTPTPPCIYASRSFRITPRPPTPAAARSASPLRGRPHTPFSVFQPSVHQITEGPELRRRPLPELQLPRATSGAHAGLSACHATIPGAEQVFDLHDALRDLGVVTHDDDETLVIAIAGGGALLVEYEDLAVGRLEQCLPRGGRGWGAGYGGWGRWGNGRGEVGAAPAVCCRTTR